MIHLHQVFITLGIFGLILEQVEKTHASLLPQGNIYRIISLVNCRLKNFEEGAMCCRILLHSDEPPQTDWNLMQ